MGRRRHEWRGATDDTPLPNAVYLRLWRRQGGRCPECGRPLRPGHIVREHLKPLWTGEGLNREHNIQLWCAIPCSQDKTSEETKTRAKADRQLYRHLGLRTRRQLKTRPLPGTKRSGWKHKLNGQWERR